MAQKLNKKLLFVVSAIGVSLVALGVFAAIVNLPVREHAIVRQAPAPA